MNERTYLFYAADAIMISVDHSVRVSASSNIQSLTAHPIYPHLIKLIQDERISALVKQRFLSAANGLSSTADLKTVEYQVHGYVE